METPKPKPPTTKLIAETQSNDPRVAPMSKPLLFNEGLLQLKRELSRENS